MTITMRKTLCTSTSTISTASQTLHAIFCVITERHIRICHPFRYSYLLTQANVAVGIAITTVVSIVGGCLSLYGADADDEGCNFTSVVETPVTIALFAWACIISFLVFYFTLSTCIYKTAKRHHTAIQEATTNNQHRQNSSCFSLTVLS